MDLIEDVRNCSRNNSSIHIFLSASCDGVCLSRASLSISKDRSIEAIEAGLYHLAVKECKYIFGNDVEHSFLLSEHVQHAVEVEVLNFILHVLVP